MSTCVDDDDDAAGSATVTGEEKTPADAAQSTDPLDLRARSSAD